MKKLLLILLCLPMIGWGQGNRYTILVKYNGIDLLMATHYEMNLLMCDHCHSDNLNDYKWKDISNWEKKGSKTLRLSYFADVNYDEDDMEYYTISEEVKKLKLGDIYWIELLFARIDMNDIFLGASLLDLVADFISAKKATDNEITEYFFKEPILEENYSDW